MSKAKVLFIANHRLNRSPGQRFRFEQYLNFLNANGFEWELSNIISKEDDQILYSSGNYFKKLGIARKAWKKRTQDIKRADEFDLIFIFREALLTRSTKFEKAFGNSKAKVIFDFDDAIWLPNVSSGNKNLQKLKKPDKINHILPYVDMVFAGNPYLANYAKKYCENVKVIPTTIDTAYHQRKKYNNTSKVCIGWTGTDTTRKYLNLLVPVFKTLKQKYQDRLYFKIICDKPWEVEGLDLINEKWDKDKEIEQLEEIDIGIMPLTDDQWSRGKCGFKALQYMAMESVPVVSPVGVNIEIVENAVNGFLANDNEEWLSKLSLLIEDKELRDGLAREARKTILERYSVEANRNLYLKYFKELLKD